MSERKVIIPLVPVETPAAGDQAAKRSVLQMALHAKRAAEATIARLRQQLGEEQEVDAVGLLKEIEWEGDAVYHLCPVCKQLRMVGHLATCRLAAIIDGD